MTDKRIGYPRKVARKLLSEFFRDFPPERLPIPIMDLAVANGFELFELDSLDNNQRAIKYSLPDERRILIGINSKYHIHNQRFSVGHELGHHYLGHLPEEESDDEEIKIFNREADEFSAELLMPLDKLKKKLQELKDPRIIARLFQVTEEALWIKIRGQNLLKYLTS